MSRNMVNEKKLEEQAESGKDLVPEKPSSDHLVLKIVGGAALALLTAGLIASFNDIKRYIRMRRM